MISSTHTHANLSVSARTFAEIKRKLKAVGYEHTFFENGDRNGIDMHGIALVNTGRKKKKREKIRYA